MTSQQIVNQVNSVNESLPFSQELIVRLERVGEETFNIRALKPTGLIISPTLLAKKLFYKHEPSYFGLRANIGDLDIHVTYAEFIELLTPRYRHPFLQLQGVDEEANTYIAQFKSAATVWDKGTFWQQVQIKDDELQFNTEYGDILQKAIEQKLSSRGIDSAQINTLLPYFQQGGWPITADHSLDGIQVALRLSEPDETSEEWLLETVVINKKLALFGHLL